MSGEYDVSTMVPGAGAPQQWIQPPPQQMPASNEPCPVLGAPHMIDPTTGAPHPHSHWDSCSPFSSPGPVCTNSSGSGSGEFSPVSSPVIPLMAPPLPPNMLLRQQQQLRFGNLPPPAMPTQPTQQLPPDVVESLRVDAEKRAEHAWMEHRAECDAKVRLARLRVAELEERARRAEAEGDEMTARMTLAEMQKEDAERARDAAEAKLKGSQEVQPQQQQQSLQDGGDVDERVQKMELEMAKVRAEAEALKKALAVAAREAEEKVRRVVDTAEEKCGKEIAAQLRMIHSDIYVYNDGASAAAAAAATETSRTDCGDMARDGAASRSRAAPPALNLPLTSTRVGKSGKTKKSLNKKHRAPHYGSLAPRNVFQRHGSMSSTHSSSSEESSSSCSGDASLAEEILEQLKRTQHLDEAVAVVDQAVQVAPELESVEKFAVKAYHEGLQLEEYHRYAVGRLIAACAVSKLLGTKGLLEALASVGREVKAIESEERPLGKYMAGYAAAAVEVRAVEIKRVCDTVLSSVGEVKGKEVIVLVAEELRERVGQEHAVTILSSKKAGLNFAWLKEGVEWLSCDERSPEDTDYSPDSRSASDTE